MPPLPDNELLASLIDTELIYQNAPSGYLSILPEGTIIKLNNTLIRWLGHTENEIVYKMKFSDLLSKGGNIHYEMFFLPMVTINGNIRELNYELLRKDGTSFPALLNGNSVKNEAGKLLAINIVITDISQRNLYEKELLKANNLVKAQKERFEFLAEVSPDMIWTANHEGRITYINQRVCQYFKMPARELDTRAIFNKIHPGDKKKWLRQWLTQTDPGKEFKTIIRLKKDEVQYEWFEVRIVQSNNQVNDIKWFGTCISIDEHVIALKRRDEFIDLASHELRTPITVLNGYLQLIQLYELPEAVSGFVEKSINSLKTFKYLISSLLNVSVINSGELKLNVSKCSLNQLLQGCADQLRHTVKTHELLLEIESKELFADVDREKMEQVIINLLTNAVKYSSGESSVVLKLSFDKAHTMAEISIKDYGEGIAISDIEKIFDKYYRAGRQKNKAGLGLGLYLSQNILRAHGTGLNVKSEVGNGSTFSFTLPVSVEV